MAGLFGNVSMDPKMERQSLNSKYNAARMNLIMVVAFSAINLLMLAFAGENASYFLFSASVPYLISLYAMLFCGMMPDDFYKDPAYDGFVFLREEFFYIALAISAMILVIYLLCWFFSKKKPVWITVALVLFAIDTVVLILFYGVFSIFDLIFHGWVIWSLVSGILADKKLKKMPKEETIIETNYTEIPTDEEWESEPAAAEDFATENYSEQSHVEAAKIEAPTDEINENKEEKEEYPHANGPLDI